MNNDLEKSSHLFTFNELIYNLIESEQIWRIIAMNLNTRHGVCLRKSNTYKKSIECIYNAKHT